MPASIYIVDGEQAGQSVVVPEGVERFTIGRRTSCDLVVRIDSISREHCYISHKDGDYWLHDNGSANATLLNGIAVEKGKLVHGDVITMDRATLEFIDEANRAKADVDRDFLVQSRPGAKYNAKNSLIGQVAGGKYKMLSVLGEGGMAVVYKARRLEDNAIVAVKMLKGGRDVDPENLQRFVKEFKTGTKLQHENIMQTYDWGEHNGNNYMVLEYIAGSTLQEILDEKGKLSERAAIHVAIEVCKALEHALSINIIHRDIKPENILVSQRGEVKLADLGLAKELKTFVSLNLTKTGEGIGTLHYMSPEQVENTKTVDQRADIYSLGATLYECLCGQPPFDEVGVWKFVEAINSKAPPPLPKLVSGLNEKTWPLIERCLAKKPDARPNTPTDLRTELEGILKDIS